MGGRRGRSGIERARLMEGGAESMDSTVTIRPPLRIPHTPPTVLTPAAPPNHDVRYTRSLGPAVHL